MAEIDQHAGQQTLQAHQQAVLGAWGKLSGSRAGEPVGDQPAAEHPADVPPNAGWHNRLDQDTQSAAGDLFHC